MAFRVLRQRRKDDLLRRGFLPFEAHALSGIPRQIKGERTRWLTLMYEARRNLVRIAKREKWGKAKFASEVKELYIRNDWVVKRTATIRKKSVGKLDPWAMARFYRDEWIRRGEEYIPPIRRKKKKPPGERRLSDKAVQEGKRKKRRSELEKYEIGRYRY